MKILFVMILTFSTLPAFASIAGDWTGWGFWAFKKEEDQTNCDLMKMTWRETATELILEKGFFECDVVAMELDRTVWKKQGQNLIDENKKTIGTYDGQNLEVIIPSPNVNTQISVKIKREANHFDYREVWFNSQEKVYIIKGRFFTSGN
jgi:hypothetical protein